jgi:hypothetical protein
MNNNEFAQQADPAYQMPVSVQVLSTLLFAAFAIPVTIVALNVFWPAGVVIAGILAWRGGFAPSMARRPDNKQIMAMVTALAPEAKQRQSGNASFDAYRTDMLTRLETEQQNFETFLDRLRDAKGKAEFDQFMDERAYVTHDDDVEYDQTNKAA